MDSGYKIAAVLGSLLAFCSLLIATAALAQGGGGDSRTGAAPVRAPARVDTYDIELGDLLIRPGTLEVTNNTVLAFTVTNHGALPHNLKLAATGTQLLDPGTSETVRFGPFNDDVQLICDVPGHAAAGMTLDIKLTGSAAADGATTSAANGATVDPNATPPPNWRAQDPAIQPAPGGNLHRLSFDAVETKIEVAPGSDAGTVDVQQPHARPGRSRQGR
jgi:nitrite reductase (NO-forming)